MTSGVAGNNLISIHAPARGATSMAAMGTTLGNGFQSTLPRGERLVKPCCLKYPFNFNPRSREGSDAEKRRGNCMAKVNFNPRSREGSDEDVTTKVDSLEISIHAPARGATSTYQHTHYSTRISIHAPARGATDFSDFFKFFLRISIHAPARGATFGTLRSIPAASLFQSTLPRGERLLCGANLKLVIQFQSTLPRGERHVLTTIMNAYRLFQSTLPRGERLLHSGQPATNSGFQSTLPRGERL